MSAENAKSTLKGYSGQRILSSYLRFAAAENER